jgi:hypothetical protein
MAACKGKGKGTGEQALLRELFDSLNEGDIVVADGYNWTYWTLAMLAAGGADVSGRIDEEEVWCAAVAWFQHEEPIDATRG